MTLHPVEEDFMQERGLTLSSNGTEWVAYARDGGYIMIWLDDGWNAMYRPADGSPGLYIMGRVRLLSMTDFLNWVDDNVRTPMQDVG